MSDRQGKSRATNNARRLDWARYSQHEKASMTHSIHQEVTIKASAKKVYDALTDAKQFSAFSGGAPAQIDATAGGSFSCFGGHIIGPKLRVGGGKAGGAGT